VQNRGEVAREQRKPVLLVDVDGVISLWGFETDRRPPGAFASVDGIPHFLSQRAAEHLLTLEDVFELVWCTGWEEKANEVMPHALGDAAAPAKDADGSTPGHWKLAAIEAYVDGRPAAWVDDALNDACRDWAARRAAPTLLVETDPAEGLIAAHAHELRAWANDLTA
jgi:hypothetical protein